MRDDIRFRMISADVVDPRTGVPRQATIAFSVSYDNASPDLAVEGRERDHQPLSQRESHRAAIAWPKTPRRSSRRKAIG